MKYCLRFILFFLPVLSFAQAPYEDYVGAGHTIDVKITTSSDDTGSATRALSGQGMLPDEGAAARFLSHAVMGFDKPMVDDLSSISFSDWIDQQYAIPQSGMLDMTRSIYEESRTLAGADPDDFPSFIFFRYAWWQHLMTSPDWLRQRVAFALSEIFVISSKSNLADYGYGMASYYDILLEHSFGNFRDLLTDVTLHPCMGFFLTHLNNPASDEEAGIHPDQNYAREIQQLFTIGLYELNMDGSQKLDANGNPIPTYDNSDVEEFAKVFTGLYGGARSEHVGYDPYFGATIWEIDMVAPMQMSEENHEYGAKTLHNNTVIPAGQTGLQDISDALDNLFNHPNVGPFIGHKLIQRLVKSNPSPAYIERVAQSFNDNGAGVRGDMKAVIKAILLDPEARDCSWIAAPSSGMLREPLVRYAHAMKAMMASNEKEKYWNGNWWFEENTDQAPLHANSIFNFFLPDYQPIGEISENGLVAPEFQITNAKTIAGYADVVIGWIYWVTMDIHNWDTPYDPDSYPDGLNDEAYKPWLVWFNYDELEGLAIDQDESLDWLDLMFFNNTMSTEMRTILTDVIEDVNQYDIYNRTRLPLYLSLIAPESLIIK